MEAFNTRRFINPFKKFTGSFLPNWLLLRPEISLGAKIIYARLCQYAGEDGIAFPKIDTLSTSVGLQSRQTQRYLQELRDHQLICAHKINNNNQNVYKFLENQWMNDQIGNVTYDVKLTSDMTCPIKRIKEDKEKKIKKEKKDQVLNKFDTFWKMYNYKKSRVDAQKAFAGLNPSDELFAKMLKAIDLQKHDREQRATCQLYVPERVYPAGWLRKERWEDELTLPQDFKKAKSNEIKCNVPDFKPEVIRKRANKAIVEENLMKMKNSLKLSSLGVQKSKDLPPTARLHCE